MNGAGSAHEVPSPPTGRSPRSISVTAAAQEALEQLSAEHGPLMFVESHGCCDSSAPMCFPVGEFLVGPSDVQVGEVAGCPYYVDARTLTFRIAADVPLYMELDVEPGYPDGMSLGPACSHFVIRPAAARPAGSGGEDAGSDSPSQIVEYE